MFVISIRPQPITTLPILQHGKCAVIEWGIETQAANRICLFKELESFTNERQMSLREQSVLLAPTYLFTP